MDDSVVKVLQDTRVPHPLSPDLAEEHATFKDNPALPRSDPIEVSEAEKSKNRIKVEQGQSASFLGPPNSYIDAISELEQPPLAASPPFSSTGKSLEARNTDVDSGSLHKGEHKPRLGPFRRGPFPNDLIVAGAGNENESISSSETSVARSAASFQAAKVIDYQQSGSRAAEWLERYPNMGVPDIHDGLSDVDSTSHSNFPGDLNGVKEIHDEFMLPSDSGYSSKNHIEPPRSRSPQVEERVGTFNLPKPQGDCGFKEPAQPEQTTISSARDDRVAKQHHTTNSELHALGADGWCDRGFHVDFGRNEMEPLKQHRFLGQGLNGPVYETKCKGIALAWKKKFRRKGVGERERREIEVMKKLRHKHIVELAGTYTQGKFFGVLIWPVAVCDLATLLDDLDAIKSCRNSSNFVEQQDPEMLERLHALGFPINKPQELHTAISRRLLRSLGCLAGAVAYFHGEGIKHKDLKPANVLLSRGGGLWVTDFESSTDFSFLTSSVTEEGERGTPKYFAPEVAGRELCGRPADMFALGCIFLEMVWMCAEDNKLDQLKDLRPKEDSLFHCSYQANLDMRDSWVSRLPTVTVLDRHLNLEIRQLLELQPGLRPTASELTKFLTAMEALNVASTEPLLHDACCVPRTSLPEFATSSSAQEMPAGGEAAAPPPPRAPENYLAAFERWEALSAHWEGLTSYWIHRLEANSDEFSDQPMLTQLSRQVTDLSAAGANLFHAVVELQRLRASSERKFQRWFYETRQEAELQLEDAGRVKDALRQERARRRIAEENARTAETAYKNAAAETATWKIRAESRGFTPPPGERKAAEDKANVDLASPSEGPSA